jgi:hypothetical protein
MPQTNRVRCHGVHDLSQSSTDAHALAVIASAIKEKLRAPMDLRSHLLIEDLRVDGGIRHDDILLCGAHWILRDERFGVFCSRSVKERERERERERRPSTSVDSPMLRKIG